MLVSRRMKRVVTGALLVSECNVFSSTNYFVFRRVKLVSQCSLYPLAFSRQVQLSSAEE